MFVGRMKDNEVWSLGPDVEVVGAELVGGHWMLSALGSGTRSCPGCGVTSTSRHSWHDRQLRDLPAQGVSVTLKLRLGRWRCRNERCGRQTFVERLPAMAEPFAHRTCRLIELVRLFAHASGGRPGERLMARLAMPASDTTILRHLKCHAAARRAPAPVRVAGIDDWSWRKGWTYGTIIVDLEQRQIVDLLADRSADATARWFEQHREVEVICRDRCGLYSQGAREGAPQARQVADRFHLLENLRDAVEAQMTSVSRFAGRSRVPVSQDRKTSGSVDQPRLGQPSHRSARQAMFDRVRQLRAAGKTMRAIAEETGVGWRTVTKWVRSGCLPDRTPMTPRPSSPGYFKNYLSQRWAAGCTHGRYLFWDIRNQGYTGSYSHLQKFLATWRLTSSETLAASQPSEPENPALDPTTGWQISPIDAAWLCLKPRGQLTPSQAVKIDALKQASPSFVIMRQLAMWFRGTLRSHDATKLNSWLDAADRSGLGAMQRFARMLRRDLEAVRNAVTERWSNGQVEGQINRLKTIKRAMYGRAGIELLRARMLPLQTSNEHGP